MNSILANIFLAVQDRLETEVTALRWIDQDLGQLEFYDKPPVLFPCALLDIVNVKYSDLSMNCQQGEAILEVRLGVAAHTQAGHVLPKKQKELALAYYDIEHLVNKALHGWSDTRLFSSLSRTSTQTERRDDNIRVRPLQYSFAFQDNTALPVPAVTVPRPELELTNSNEETVS